MGDEAGINGRGTPENGVPLVYPKDEPRLNGGVEAGSWQDGQGKSTKKWDIVGHSATWAGLISCLTRSFTMVDLLH